MIKFNAPRTCPRQWLRQVDGKTCGGDADGEARLKAGEPEGEQREHDGLLKAEKDADDGAAHEQYGSRLAGDAHGDQRLQGDERHLACAVQCTVG